MSNEMEKIGSLDNENTQAQNSNTTPENKPIDEESQETFENILVQLVQIGTMPDTCQERQSEKVIENINAQFGTMLDACQEKFTPLLKAFKLTFDLALERVPNMVQKAFQEAEPKIQNLLKLIQDDIVKREKYLLDEIERLKKESKESKIKTELEEIKTNLESRKYGLSYLREVLERLKAIEKEIESKKKGKSLVKGSLNLDENLFGLNSIQKKEKAEGIPEEQTKNIEMGNLDLSKPEGDALFALQKSMSDRNYKSDVCFHGDVERPIYSITTKEYLENFGVSKRKTARGFQEFLSNERKQALDALESLESKKALLVWKTPIGNTGKSDVYWMYEPILVIIRNTQKLSQEELEKLCIDEERNQKADRIFFIPHKIVFQNIDRYFWLKDSNYRKEIKEITGKKNNKYINLFIDKLYEQASHKIRINQALTFERTREQLAYDLHMESDINKRNWKRIEQNIEYAIKIALELKYILAYETGKAQNSKPKYSFTLNPERYYHKKTLSGNQE